MMRRFLFTAIFLNFFPGLSIGQGFDPRRFEDGIKVEFVKPEYQFTTAEAAKGLKIEYRILVAQDFPHIIALPHGPSSNTPPGPSGLFPLEKVSGNGQMYCLLDFGLGPPPKEEPKTVKKGIFTHAFTWDGRNWAGPSDTGQPKGPPFPAGEYQISITLHGKVKTEAGTRPYQITKSTKLILKAG